eukprot:Filipodium_phascolosomae@DN1862_c0_g1_i2.p2
MIADVTTESAAPQTVDIPANEKVVDEAGASSSKTDEPSAETAEEAAVENDALQNEQMESSFKQSETKVDAKPKKASRFKGMFDKKKKAPEGADGKQKSKVCSVQ